jgi:hypothetical protein
MAILICVEITEGGNSLSLTISITHKDRMQPNLLGQFCLRTVCNQTYSGSFAYSTSFAKIMPKMTKMTCEVVKDQESTSKSRSA